MKTTIKVITKIMMKMTAKISLSSSKSFVDDASHELDPIESLEHIEVRFGLFSVIIFILLEHK